MNTAHTPRIYFLFGLFVLFALVLVGRLFFVQIVEGKEFAARADDQYTTPAPNTLNRGSIYFKERDGLSVSAATLKAGYTIAINPKKIAKTPNANEVLASMYEKISAITPLLKEDFFVKAGRTDDPYEEVARRISKDAAEKVIALSIPGVSVHRESWRFYPGKTTAAHVLGFMGYQGDAVSGRYGIERYYNDILSRESDGIYTNFFAELFSNLARAVVRGENSREGDIVLTIEPNVQKQLETELSGIREKWSADTLGGIIMDPRTGKIYAMAALPNFDPNVFQKEKQVSVFSNPHVESVYEMGSIIKPLTMAAALDAGVVRPESTYKDEGVVIVDGKRISNFDGKARGVVSMQEVLSQSLNTGMVHVMKKIGRDRFSSYMRRYKLGEETGIELPVETRGLVANLDSPRDLEHATAAFGQGIAMTPIQAVRALAALGNGGFLIDPYIVDSVQYTWGGSRMTVPAEPTRILKQSTSEDITRMLVAVVDKALLGGTVALPHYSVAAKTGTAQIPDLSEGGYYADQYLHSFFGYFPAYDPQFLVFLYQVRPQGARYASETLTNPFMNLTQFLINYYEIAPDR
mgnify:FL=1